jgi:hypothetical protein
MSEGQPLHCEVVENGRRCPRLGEREWSELQPDSSTIPSAWDVRPGGRPKSRPARETAKELSLARSELGRGQSSSHFHF